ncbi:hypothetical protein AB1Y20_012434 [Prymnesium parvum]|uniref:CENP-V/GFA domain-containing protein n=1 Tax=Prymnesium parvum TaxID=97485 RepID=A0AB34IJH4_PRYPA
MGGLLSSPGELRPPVAASCACGRCQLLIHERPVLSFKCHCSTCLRFRSMKPLSSVEELDTHQPNVGLFRRSAVQIVSGEEALGSWHTRGSFPFFVGMDRRYCVACKTPGVVEYFRDCFYRTSFLGATCVYLGYVCPDAPELRDFDFHVASQSATPGAKKLMQHDGKRKFGLISGLLAIVAISFVPALRRLLLGSGSRQQVEKRTTLF